MDGIKTEDDRIITLSGKQWDALTGRLDHHDQYLHRIDQAVTKITAFIDDNAPHLERARTLMDPALKLRTMIGRKKN